MASMIYVRIQIFFFFFKNTNLAFRKIFIILYKDMYLGPVQNCISCQRAVVYTYCPTQEAEARGSLGYTSSLGIIARPCLKRKEWGKEVGEKKGRRNL